MWGHTLLRTHAIMSVYSVAMQASEFCPQTGLPCPHNVWAVTYIQSLIMASATRVLAQRVLFSLFKDYSLSYISHVYLHVM
jgi:hypothetical protein